MVERRHFSRILYQVPATLTHSGDEWQAEVRDLSLRGILLTCPDNWRASPDGRYWVKFCLHECDIALRMETELVHHDAHYLRMQIYHIDIESAGHLRRLVELNVGTDELLHRELEQLADLQKPINE
ncbi:PilZ domain-containing protein [Photobacterium sanctipauli]|uniref:Cyclic diguanosine monophosphate-binding protein n=1 Tax=Photobacterium sanctipauli TaxID=1342794 RepID=A0A2T3NP28_9GAMM|nr:PilZ domain-containing protein [Photobacterium sanctipauli]PSW18011.1 PilZ domain-containing protein [Photobacterium sanctipauli]